MLVNKVNIFHELAESFLKLFDSTRIINVIVSDSDWSAFFEVFNLGAVTLGNGLRVEWAIWALGNALAT